ncbi:MAG: heavy metal translocating P-type ATPase metal-binding domain-containing protein [Polyangiales bacterium]
MTVDLETPAALPAARACAHCGAETEGGARFCCIGCRAVSSLLSARGLERYYDLRGESSAPASAPRAHRDLKWLDAMESSLRGASRAQCVELDLQGIQCAACVWLQEELFKRHAADGAGLDISVNPALGKVELLVAPGFDLRGYIEDVEQFGYLFGPAVKRAKQGSSGLLGRVGLSIALALNAMLFSIPLYYGLHEGTVYGVFRWAAFLLATASVGVGASVFARSAWQGARRGVLHLDVPIALGAVLGYLGSAAHFFAGRDQGAYFDTVTTFIALMLVGRWLQERVLDRNRMQLLADDGTDALLARRVVDGRMGVIPCADIAAGDVLLVAPGDLVPVAATLRDAEASVSLDWIDGESAPRAKVQGEELPAGSFNVGARAVTVEAREPFADSRLPNLLRRTVERDGEAPRASAWWNKLTKVYVLAVLALATLGFVGWYLVTGELSRAAQVATSVLVVTCPCAFGIATPTAYELVQAGLRRLGLFVRSAGFLDRMTEVRRVVFDKTGTLTTGALTLRDPDGLRALDPEARRALGNMVARSLHPRSAAVREALAIDGEVVLDESLAVSEETGRGVEMSHEGRRYRFGRGDWAASGGDPDSTLFSVDGEVLARLDAVERLRPDAAHELRRLTDDGYEVWILSGDAPERVQRMAEALGIAPERAVGGCSPEDKAAWLDAHDRGDTLMIGDGINDVLAAQRAHCALTPAVDRPFMPARTDAWFVTPGLRPVRLALRAAHALRGTVRRNLAVATVYNTAAVGLCLAGRMSPLLAALLMPLSSLSILAATIAALSPRSALWKS